MSKHSYQEGVVLCTVEGKRRAVHIKINANNLVVCPEWKKCPNHGKPDCQEKQIHNEIIERIKKRRAKKTSPNIDVLMRYLLSR